MFKKIAITLLLIFFLTQSHANEWIKVIADRHSSAEAKQEAFNTLLTSSPLREPQFISYCDLEEIDILKEVPSSIYAEIVKTMTISCVDAFVYNFENNTYLMILRANPPGNGKWWMPGGRIFKGESFYECAVRKAKRESGVDICPIAQLGTYTTYFLESAWGDGVHTDTKNTVVLALCNEQSPELDELHETFKWVPIDEIPEDPYLLAAYNEAKAKLKELGFTCGQHQI